jgi:hypothetical protein
MACRLLCYPDMKLPVLASLVLIGACGVGDPAPPTNPMQAAERLCTDTYTLAGNFSLGMASPDRVDNETQQPPGDGTPDIQGCWPVGTWTFTLTRTGGDCSPAPTLPSVTFQVDFIDDPIEPAYEEILTAPSIADHRLHVSQGGGGLCEGGLELYSADGKEVFNLHPTLNVFNTNGPLGGSGEFSRFSKNQTPETL